MPFFTSPAAQQAGDAVLWAEDQSFVNNISRLAVGIVPLVVFGTVGTVEQSILAPMVGQIPLLGGFTLATPFSAPPRYYSVGRRGESRSLQLGPHVAGQSVLGTPIRTHTTGLIDYAVRSPSETLHRFASLAEEAVHPGRSSAIDRERL